MLKMLVIAAYLFQVSFALATPDFSNIPNQNDLECVSLNNSIEDSHRPIHDTNLDSELELDLEDLTDEYVILSNKYNLRVQTLFISVPHLTNVKLYYSISWRPPMGLV